ncbi:MAG TPA: hypothetical protein VM282_25095 [Acidimicrobiales bacterium]|nr:hypothetical protein [Acidimicrobiales bacterium]
MPVARGPRMTARSAIVVGLAGVLSAVILLFFVLWVTSQSGNKIEFRLGDEQFQDITADRMAKQIADEGPVLFPDVSANRSRDIYVQHLGADPKTGWLAFDARKPGAGRECFLEWQRDRQIFVDRCDGSEVPADGAGLRQYPAVVNSNGKVVINFNAGASTTTTAPPASSVAR